MLLSTLPVSKTFAQDHEQQIRNIRQASNEALRAYNNELVLSFLTEDVLTTTGNGTLLAGKEALSKYIAAAGESKMFWVRTPEEIKVNEVKGLAWENGTWKGYDPEKGDTSIVGGSYAAMWTKETGQWLIKSQLFVALD
ncbi:nuclear transport factor 2 family protein [Robiginitalea sp. SC105]|nr:nuclear transport factor 2 family protein [Robiginitalea sp. SC105]